MSEWKNYKLSEFIEINPKVTLKSGIQHSFVEMKDLNEVSVSITFTANYNSQSFKVDFNIKG